MPENIEMDAAGHDLEIIRVEFSSELENAFDVAKRLSEQMPRDFNWTEEPAHTFSASLLRSKEK